MTSTVEAPQAVGYRRALDELRTMTSVGRLLARGVPRVPRVGHGAVVMTLPGFGAGDASMAIIRQRLRRQGFQTHKWQLGVNRGDVPALLARATERVHALVDSTGEPINLVGWSLGGYIAREIARDQPKAIRHVVTLGSPIVGGPKFTAVAGWYRRQGVDLDAIAEAVAERARTPLTVPVTCVYSRRDGIVDWRAARDDQNPLTTNVEVDCSHLAMGFDPAVLDIIPAALAPR